MKPQKHGITTFTSPVDRLARARERDGETDVSHLSHTSHANGQASSALMAPHFAQHAKTGTPDVPLRITRIRKEADHTLHYLVTVDLGGGCSTDLTIDLTRSLGQMAKDIARVSQHLFQDPEVAKEQLAALIAAAPDQIITAVAYGGWKAPGAYIGPDLRRGRDWNRYVWTGPRLPGANLSSGTLGGWLHTVAGPCAESSCLIFALLVALAGPVLYWADLPSGAAFHFAGPTASGITTTARVAASIDGPPDSHGHWYHSGRCDDERAVLRCDRVSILNAAETAERGDLQAVLSRIIYGPFEGGGKRRAAAVGVIRPDLHRRSPILSNGNGSGAELARMAGLFWNEEAAARFITIPVPSGEEGSIVDRPMSTEPNYAIAFIDRLEAGMKCHHGRVMGRWLDQVWAHRERVDELIAEFVATARPANAVERRMAQQFGLIDATAQIAVGTRFLPWKATLPRSVVIDFYRSAVAALKVGCSVEALVALRAGLSDLAVFPDIGAAKELIFDARMVGFRFSQSGDEFVAIRQERLGTVLGATTQPAVLIGALEEAGVVERGHGARRGKQLHVRLISRTSDHISAKPRCLVVKAAALEAFLEAAGPGQCPDEDAIVVA